MSKCKEKPAVDRHGIVGGGETMRNGLPSASITGETHLELVPPVSDGLNFLQNDRNVFASLETMETLSGELDNQLRIRNDMPHDTTQKGPNNAPAMSDLLHESTSNGNRPTASAALATSTEHNTLAYLDHRSQLIYSPAYSDQSVYSPTEHIAHSPAYDQNSLSPAHPDVANNPDLAIQMSPVNIATASTHVVCGLHNGISYTNGTALPQVGAQGIIEGSAPSNVKHFPANSQTASIYASNSMMNYNLGNDPNNMQTPFYRYMLQTDDGHPGAVDSATANNNRLLTTELPLIGQKRVRERRVKAEENDTLFDLTSLSEIDQVIQSDSFSSYGRDKKMPCGEPIMSALEALSAPNGLQPYPAYQPYTTNRHSTTQNFSTNIGNFPQHYAPDYDPSQRNIPNNLWTFPPSERTNSTYLNNGSIPLVGQQYQPDQHHMYTNITTRLQTPTTTTPQQTPTTTTPQQTQTNYSQTPASHSAGLLLPYLGTTQNGGNLSNNLTNQSTGMDPDCIIVSSYPGQPSSVSHIKEEVSRIVDLSGPTQPTASTTTAPPLVADASNCYERLANVQDEDGGKIFHYLVELYEKLIVTGNQEKATKLLPLTLTYLNHPSLRRLLHHADINWQTPLHLAVEKNLSRLTTIFLHYGADVNAVAKQHSVSGMTLQTPLHIAVSRGDDAVKIVRLLLATNRLEINKRNSEGETALHLACKVHGQCNEHGERIICYHVIQLLMENMDRDVELNAEEYKTGRTPLMLAVITKDLHFIEEFLAHIDNTILHSVLNHHDNSNNTSMHYAGGLKGVDMEQHTRIVWHLLSRGGEPDTVNKNKETARAFAQKVFDQAVNWMQGK